MAGSSYAPPSPTALSLRVIRRSGSSKPSLPSPPLSMLMKQPIAPSRRGQCTVQRKQHVEKGWTVGGFKACLYKDGVSYVYVCVCVCVACLLTFAAQQSILQMHMQTIKVTYGGGCVYVAPSSFVVSSLALCAPNDKLHENCRRLQLSQVCVSRNVEQLLPGHLSSFH